MERGFVAIVVLFLVVGACGDRDTAGGGDPSTRVVNGSDFAFESDTFDVQAGREITVELRNRGAVEHTWTVLAAGVQAASAEDIVPSDILSNVSASAAQSDSVTVVVPAAGSYQVICSVPGHLEAGMEATLRSEPAPSARGADS